MRIWLPPSEGKTAPESGPRLDLSALLIPELADARAELIAALEAVGDGDHAASVLGLGTKSAAESALNICLDTAHCAPAIELYTGVLYDHLDAASLDPAARARLDGCTWIASGLFGFVRTTDPLPNHRLAMGVSLPPLGPLARWWRKRLAAVIPDLSGEAIVDCRSGAYRAAYPAAEANVVEIAVVEERAAGRTVITHMAKKWRGLAVRHLVNDPPLAGWQGDLMGQASPRADNRSLAELGRERAPRANGVLDDVLESLARLAGRPEIIDVEITPSQPTRAAGTLTHVTLVTESTQG